jgi:hypothetical protein
MWSGIWCSTGGVHAQLCRGGADSDLLRREQALSHRCGLRTTRGGVARGHNLEADGRGPRQRRRRQHQLAHARADIHEDRADRGAGRREAVDGRQPLKQRHDAPRADLAVRQRLRSAA